MTEKTVNKAPSGRPNRKPVGFRNRLAVFDKDPNFEYRWVSSRMNNGSRIQECLDAGYEFVQKSAQRSTTGRIEAGPKGLPNLGTAVRKGDVLAYLVSSLAPIEQSNQFAQLAELKAAKSLAIS